VASAGPDHRCSPSAKIRRLEGHDGYPDVVSFVLAGVRGPPRRVLEVGCGGGELASALAVAGHDVVAIDPKAPTGAIFRRMRLQEFDDPARFDAVVASLSLHHIPQLEAAVEKIARVLRPQGRLLLNEFAWERLDRRAARWVVEREATTHPGRSDRVDEVQAEWKREHDGLHTGASLLTALEGYFECLRLEWVPYIARMIGDPAAEPEEARAIAEGRLDPVGFRWIGRTILGR
jgi:ubiquinone/menaquinone biosynthesis C-methylase UbiE